DPGGGGSCPYVFGWNGKEFIPDNNILPQSEYTGNENKIVTDYYKLFVPPKLDNVGIHPFGNRYVIKLKEFESELTSFDQAQLIAIDHSKSTNVAVLPDGEIIQYKVPFIINGEFTDRLSGSDGLVIHLRKGENITLDFRATQKEYKRSLENVRGGLLLGGWVNYGNNRTIQAPAPPPKVEKVGDVNGGWPNRNEPSPFTFRERPTLVYIPLEKFDRIVTIEVEDPAAIDYANLAVEVPPSYTYHNLKLLKGYHSYEGDITSAVLQNDEHITQLAPNETIDLEYEAPILEANMSRSFILIGSGKYMHVDGISGRERPKEFQLSQNHPNPFNPVTRIEYAVPVNVYVTLKVYNVLGQEVLTLVDELQDAGYKSVTFDAGNLSSGVYYYRITAGEYSDYKKMLLIR
ncbi:MAG: T9SS type A sorting domain-containing protein, partial [Ignavibacteriales bacterium]|nr:T9SS type A sorting domain-containing protein [Ignavibacteriales bacterium]